MDASSSEINNNNNNSKGLVHILDVRDWMLSLYEEKCSTLLNKLSSSVIPELCPHYNKFYKAMLDECERKMYDLRTYVVNVEVAGFNNYGKNLLCNHMLRRDILIPVDKSGKDTSPVRLCFESGPATQHNNAKLQFKDESSFLMQVKKAEELSSLWDQDTFAEWMMYKAKLQDIYARRFEGVTYKTLSNEEISILSRQPSMVRNALFSKITLVTQVLGISRYGITLSEASITSNTTFEFEQLFTKSQVIVIVMDDPEVQLTAQTLNACMQQKINGKDIIFVLHRKYGSDAHTNLQFDFITTTMNKCNMFVNEKIHVLDFGNPGVAERSMLAFERHLSSKIAENIRARLISCVEQFFQLVSCAERLLTSFVSSYSANTSPEKVDFAKYTTQEEIFEKRLSKVEKKLSKDISDLKKSSTKFFKEFIKDMVPYMEIQAGKCQIKSSEILDMRHEILIALNSTFRTSFEGLYLEWVHVKRLSFAQCLLDAMTPLLDYIQLEVGRNYPPSASFLLQYAKGIVASEEQQSEDFKVTVANKGIIVSENTFQIHLEDVPLLVKNGASIRRLAYMEYLVHLMRMQGDNRVPLSLSAGAFGVCTVLLEYMVQNIRKGFATMKALARVMYPSPTQVDYSMLCRVLYLRDDIVRHLKQLNSMLLSVAEFPTLARMRKVVATYSFSDPKTCAMCLNKYTRCSHLCASCCVGLKGEPCPFCNKWSHFSSELHANVSNMNIFISNLARNEVVPQNQHWANSNNRPQIFNAMNKNARVISDFQHWYSEILNRNDFTSSKATEVFTCFVNAIIAKHTPPECHNLPENYQKIMMKCVCEMFSDDFFPAILNVFKAEYREQDEALHARTEKFKNQKASVFISEYENSSVLDSLDLFVAVVEFNKISEHTRPADKCERVLKAAEIITNLFCQQHVLMGADLFLPCIVFVLVQSNLSQPVAEFHFLCSFMETHCAHFEQYVLQTFYSVVVSAPSLLDQMLLEQGLLLEVQ